MCRPDIVPNLGHCPKSPSRKNTGKKKMNILESIHSKTSMLALHTTKTTIVGGLRIFDFHALLGVSSLLLSTTALISPTTTQWVVMLSVIATTTLSFHSSYALLDQVPLKTTICKHPILVVAPHREAFQRTSIIMQYTNARILGMLDLPKAFPAQTSMLLITICLLRMIPTKNLEWSNGNTYCFVIPMLLSVVGDYVVIMMTDFNVTNTTTAALLSCDHNWLTLRHLLFVQLSGLWIAFLFTLSFRKHINIQILYFTSALAVNAMFLSGLAFAFYKYFDC